MDNEAGEMPDSFILLFSATPEVLGLKEAAQEIFVDFRFM